MNTTKSVNGEILPKIIEISHGVLPARLDPCHRTESAPSRGGSGKARGAATRCAPGSIRSLRHGEWSKPEIAWLGGRATVD